MAPYKEKDKVNEAVSSLLNSKCAAKLVAHFTWLFLVTISDISWGRTSMHSTWR